MKFANLLKLLFALSIPFACKKGEPAVAGPESSAMGLEIIWETPIVANPNTTGGLGMDPCIHDSMVVFSTSTTYLGKGAPVLFMNKSTGQIIDTWSDYIEGPWVYTDETAQTLDGYLILSSITSIDCINLNTRKTQWSEKFQAVGPKIYLSDDFVYTGVIFNNKASAAVVRTRPESNQWDTVFAFTSTDGYTPRFDGINFGEMANGDEVVVWKNRSSKWSRSRTDIFAYNLSADSLLWRNTDYELVSGGSVLQVDQNRVYAMVNKRIFALDLQNGNVLWDTDFQGMVSMINSANMDVGLFWQHGDSLVLKGDAPELLYIKKNTGYLGHRSILDEGNSGGDVEEFEGNYYITTSSAIYIVEAKSGAILFTTKGDPRFYNREVRSKVTIDPETRLMYFQNGSHAFCAKIPEGI